MRSRSIALSIAFSTHTFAQSLASIPDYVFTYAPLIYLDVNEIYYPSDIAAQLAHTYPASNFTAINNAPSNLTLSNLSSLNALGNCTSFSDCNIYLTSRDPITPANESASWLHGVLPNPSTGETENATSAVIILRDHQDANRTVDAFYFFFYAFNGGLPAVGQIFGNHVGDWEHMMVRFEAGKPSTVYYSEHSGGEAFSYDAVTKDDATRTRPVGFSSLGGHAMYVQQGLHPLYGGIANDSTSRGPRWDPVAGSAAWYYVFTAETGGDGNNGTFEAVAVDGRNARGVGAVDWLYFQGRWGDLQYNASYPGQMILQGVTATFESGPTGPLDKDLVRSQACPDGRACSTLTTIPPVSGTPISQTVSRSYASTTASATTNRTPSGTSSGAMQATSSGAAGSRVRGTVPYAGLFGLGCYWLL